MWEKKFHFCWAFGTTPFCEGFEAFGLGGAGFLGLRTSLLLRRWLLAMIVPFVVKASIVPPACTYSDAEGWRARGRVLTPSSVSGSVVSLSRQQS